MKKPQIFGGDNTKSMLAVWREWRCITSMKNCEKLFKQMSEQLQKS